MWKRNNIVILPMIEELGKNARMHFAKVALNRKSFEGKLKKNVFYSGQ